MIVFTTSTTAHFAQKLPFQHGAWTIKQFSDGELYVHIDQDVNNKDVCVLVSTQPPTEHFFELFFLVDALQRAGAHINLFITYFSYARQITADVGESLSAAVISNLLKTFTLKKIVIIHPHSALLHNFLSFTDIRDTAFFCDLAASYDAVVAPDKGATAFVQEVATKTGKDCIVLTKKRPEQEQVEIVSISGSVINKKLLLIDDMISTGRTLVHAAQSLISHGARSIDAAATHGVFAPGAHALLLQSPIEKIYVTNSRVQHLENIIVHDISPVITTVIKTL